jgi:hypothetical protein
MQPADLISLIALTLIATGAFASGFVLARARQPQRTVTMANSADQLKAAAADAVAASKAKDDQIASLQSQLTAAQADLAADEAAIAEIIPTLPKTAPAAG